jgi:hypothetical protein
MSDEGGRRGRGKQVEETKRTGGNKGQQEGKREALRSQEDKERAIGGKGWRRKA